MAVIHIGTATTLATIVSTDISNGDIAYIWLNDYNRKMVYDSVSTKIEDTTNHPYYIQPDNLPALGMWVEDVGADQPEAWNGAQIRTGIIASTNWVDGTSGTMLDLDNELIAIKDDTFGNAGIQIGWISSAAKIYVGDGNNAFLQFDGTALTWKGANSELDASGNIVCTGGTFGGWTIGLDYIKDTAGVVGLSSAVTAGDDIRFWAGHTTPGSAPFRVTEAGELTATDANISGAITGSTIDIGGADATSFHVDTDGNMWLGAAAFDIATNPFAVSNEGALRAVSGGVGGWTLGTATLYSTNIGLISGASAEILLGHATTYADAKIGLKNDGSGKLASGNISWDTSGNLTLAGAFSSSATITGGTIQTGASGARSVLGSDGLAIYDATTQRAKIGSDGSGWLGASDVLSWTSAGVLTLAGFTPSSSDITVTNGANTVIISSGATAFSAGPTGVPTVTITQAGALTAESGVLAGWTAIANAFYKLDSGTPTSSPDNGITLETTGGTNSKPVIKVYDATTLNAAIGNYADGKYGLYGIEGLIGGWTISSTELSSTQIKLTPGASAEILLGADVSSYANAAIGLKNDGSGKLASGNISWTSAGVLTQTLLNGGSIILSPGSDITLSSDYLTTNYGSLIFKAQQSDDSFFETEILPETGSKGLRIIPHAAGGVLRLADTFLEQWAYVEMEAATQINIEVNNTIANYYARLRTYSNTYFQASMSARYSANQISIDCIANSTQAYINIGPIWLDANGINLDSAYWIGLGSAAGRIVFTDAATDIIAFHSCNITIDGNLTQADAKYIATDEVRARDSGGLKLYDDSGAVGIFVEDGGQVGINTTSPGQLLEISGVDAKLLIQGSVAAAVQLEDNATANDPAFEWQAYSGRARLNYIDDAPTTSPDLMSVLGSGNVGINETAPNQKLTVGGSISLVDQAAAAADTAGYGQIWVSNATPDELWFTDDAGTDTQISSHPQDAPAELYINGPGLDWIGKRVQKYLGVIFWQKIDGTITEETFEAYNLRRKDEPGHVDLVKRDWDTVQLAKLREQKLQEVIETEVALADAFESVEITEEIQTGTKSEGFIYSIDKDEKVIVPEKIIPIMTKQGTGQFEKRLKADVSFDDKTGKFIHKRTMTEAEVDALDLQPPEMPPWMFKWTQDQIIKGETL